MSEWKYIITKEAKERIEKSSLQKFTEEEREELKAISKEIQKKVIIK